MTDLERLLLLCEQSGGYADPHKVLLLCRTVRLYAGIVHDMAVIINAGSIEPDTVGGMADRMEAVRNLRMTNARPQGEPS